MGFPRKTRKKVMRVTSKLHREEWRESRVLTPRERLGRETTPDHLFGDGVEVPAARLSDLWNLRGTVFRDGKVVAYVPNETDARAARAMGDSNYAGKEGADNVSYLRETADETPELLDEELDAIEATMGLTPTRNVLGMPVLTDVVKSARVHDTNVRLPLSLFDGLGSLRRRVIPLARLPLPVAAAVENYIGGVHEDNPLSASYGHEQH